MLPEVDWRARFSEPQLRATAALFSHPRANVLAGGGSGGGKTAWIAWSCLYYGTHNLQHLGIEGCVGGVLSDTYESMRDRVIREFVETLSWAGSYVQSDKLYGRCWRWHDPRLGVTIFRNMKELDDFRGKQLDYVMVDELSTHRAIHNGEKILQLLRTPLRGSARPVQARPLAGASNWDGIGMSWMMDAWWNLENLDSSGRPLPWTQEKHGQGYPKESFQFVPFLIDDNPDKAFVESYKPHLESLSGLLFESRAKGRPVKPQGAYFKEFEEGLQTFNFREKFPRGIPAHWRIIMGVDWGTAAPFCALWSAIDDYGDIWTFREAYERNLSDPEQVGLIMQMTGRNERIEYLRYDPAMAAERKDVHLKKQRSPISVYREALQNDPRFGPLLPGPNDSRSLNFNALRMIMSRRPEYWGAKWHIAENCPNLIEEIKSAMHEDRHGDFVDGVLKPECADHALTAAAYHLRLHQEGAVKVLDPREVLAGAITLNSDEQTIFETVPFGGPRRGKRDQF